MLQTIRDRVTSWIAYIIIGLIIITFALWGIGSYFGEPSAPDVAEINGAPITLQEFQQALQQQRQQFPETDISFLKPIILQQLISERLLLQMAQEQGLRIDDQLLQQAILSYQVFQEDGVFNNERYKQILRAQNLSEAAFEESLRGNLMVEQLREGLTATAIVTPAETDQHIRLLKQKRKLRYVLLPFKNYVNKISVDDSAIKEYFEENKDRFVNPEQVKVDYLELDVAKIAANIPINEGDLEAAYRQDLTKFTEPETRSASHILVTVATDASEADMEKARARAQSIYQAISSGAKTFQDASIKLQDDKEIETGELGVITPGMYEDPVFESALYALKNAGDVSEPVQTKFGFHIIRVDTIEPEKTKPFAEVRDEIAQELRLREAENRFYDLTEDLANLIYEHGDSLEPAAQTLDLEIQISPWFTHQGGEGIADYPEVVAAAFSEDVLKGGSNSDIIELAPDHLIVVRVHDHKEKSSRTLEEAQEDIVSQLKEQQAREKIVEDAETLKERAAKGESLTGLADEFAGQLKALGFVERQAPEVDPALLNRAFSLPRESENSVAWGIAALSNGDQAIIAVDRIVPGKIDDVTDAERKILTQQLAGRFGASAFGNFLSSLRESADIVTYNDRL